MTTPASMRDRTIGDVEAGRHLGRSWLLLFGVLPFEYDDITIVELEEGRRFLEHSLMLSLRWWQHERTLGRSGDACSVRDLVSFELRRPLAWLPGLERLLRAGLRRLFRHRHARLARRFGSVSGGRS
jgi:hypothetical protein